MIFNKYNSLLILVSIFILIGWMSWNTYAYFFSLGLPVITIQAIEPNGYYTGDVLCIVTAQDNYNIKHLSVLLDQNLLVDKYTINKPEFEYSFVIPTKRLSTGEHTLTVKAESSCYNKSVSSDAINFNVDNLPLKIIAIKNRAKVFQGHTLHIEFQVNKNIRCASVTALSKSYSCIKSNLDPLNHECFIPISCNETPNEYIFSIELIDLVGNKLTFESKFQVVLYPFATESINDTFSNFIKNINQVTYFDVINYIQSESYNLLPDKLWYDCFCVPVNINNSIIKPFGILNKLQDKIMQLKSVNLINKSDTSVYAPQQGIIIKKDNMVIIDHGCNIISVISGLNLTINNISGEFLKTSGSFIKKGEIIAKINDVKKGIIWQLYVNNIAVNPMQWVSVDF